LGCPTAVTPILANDSIKTIITAVTPMITIPTAERLKAVVKAVVNAVPSAVPNAVPSAVPNAVSGIIHKFIDFDFVELRFAPVLRLLRPHLALPKRLREGEVGSEVSTTSK